MEDFYLQQERNAYFVPNVHYKIPKRVDPVRISQKVKKNMLKENSMYQKQEESAGETMDVNLVSKDMELNFSNKNEEDDDELGMQSDKDTSKQEIEQMDYEKPEKFKFEEEKDFQMKKQQVQGKPTGRNKLQQETLEPTLTPSENGKKQTTQ